jgi:hypothetical protein
MLNATCCSYKGCSITTRWTEVRSMSEGGVELDQTSLGLTGRFIACFSVDFQVASAESWQQFLLTDFDSSAHAQENALATAKRSIDLRFAR